MSDSESVEPTTLITGLKAASAAKGAAQGAPTLVRKGLRQLRLLGTFEPSWLELGDEESAKPAEFSAKQIADVHQFLASGQISPILIMLTLIRLSPSGPEKDHALEVVQDAFRNEAVKWNADSGSPWRKQIDALWKRINFVYESVLPENKVPQQFASEIENFSAFVQSPLQMPRMGTSNKLYIDELIRLASDLKQLTKTFVEAERLASAVHTEDRQSIITHSHAELDHHADFKKLYIGRKFVDTDSGEIIDAEALALEQALFRVVLMGQPGAGKSTFVTHLVASACDPLRTDTPVGTVVVRCREYLSKGWDSPIVSFVTRQLTAGTSFTFTDDDMIRIFLLGKAICVFDGLDEITDRSQRAEMVKRIHSFTARFPAVSILVTTREVGYEHTPLAKSVFAHVRLDEFTINQVEEYSAKWFGLVGKPELTERFILESESAADLRTNPLLLSLLCILYRDSGAIPADRRGIYSKCAELLFRTWDAHRQITQPGSMPKYADRLMQEIARWFYNTPSTEAGLEEKQIAKVLALYMESTLGFAKDEAERASRDFMAFCAERAWLLGVVGTNNYGQRLFRFTHRTFYEFFAAESLARQSETADDICNQIEYAWSRDATSVVPELLVQAYDHAHERGAARVFQQLCSRKAANLLLLRLIGGTILPSYARKTGFDLVLSRWLHSSDGVDAVEFLSLLTINPQARGQFVAEYLRPRSDVGSIALFVESWASLQNSGAGAPVRDAWSELISQILSEVDFDALLERTRFTALDNWAIGLGYQIPRRHDLLSYLMSSGTYGPTPGVIWWTIESVFGARSLLNQNKVRSEITQRLHDTLTSRETLPRRYVEGLYAVLIAQGQPFVEWGPCAAMGVEERQLRDILAIVLASCFEGHPNALDFMHAADDVWRHPISAVATIRRKKLVEGIEPTREDVAVARQALDDLPAILREWAIGRRNLLSSPN